MRRRDLQLTWSHYSDLTRASTGRLLLSDNVQEVVKVLSILANLISDGTFFFSAVKISKRKKVLRAKRLAVDPKMYRL